MKEIPSVRPFSSFPTDCRARVLAALLVSCAVLCAPAARAGAQQSPAANSQSVAPGSKDLALPPREIPHSQRGEQWMAARFGIDDIHVRSISSGSSLEFRYRVLDADKAAVLTDRNTTPYMIDQETGIKLQVPVMEKIGALRQTTTPQVGKQYWMIFANYGKLVKPGRRVDVVCGTFHIRGLTVE
jgi:hypothetical protein